MLIQLLRRFLAPYKGALAAVVLLQLVATGGMLLLRQGIDVAIEAQPWGKMAHHGLPAIPSLSAANAARINAVANTIRGEPSRMRARGVLLTMALGFAPASSS